MNLSVEQNWMWKLICTFTVNYIGIQGLEGLKNPSCPASCVPYPLLPGVKMKIYNCTTMKEKYMYMYMYTMCIHGLILCWHWTILDHPGRLYVLVTQVILLKISFHSVTVLSIWVMQAVLRCLSPLLPPGDMISWFYGWLPPPGHVQECSLHGLHTAPWQCSLEGCCIHVIRVYLSTVKDCEKRRNFRVK